MIAAHIAWSTVVACTVVWIILLGSISNPARRMIQSARSAVCMRSETFSKEHVTQSITHSQRGIRCYLNKHVTIVWGRCLYAW